MCRECSNQDSENAKTSLLSCLHINAASVFTMLAAFYFFATAGACIGKKVHDNSADRLDGFVNRRFDSFTLYIREFLISSGSYVILSMNERSVKLEMNNYRFWKN